MLPLLKYVPYLAHYEWFTTARRARALVSGKKDAALVLSLMFWPTVPLEPKPEPKPLAEPHAVDQPDGECFEPENVPVEDAKPELSDSKNLAIKRDDAVIDRFLEHGEYKIVVSTGDDEPAEQMAVDIDIDPTIASVELAEVYRAQGLDDKADEIYRLLGNNH